MTAPLAYTYNARNRMSALSGGSPARTATYIYNALEQMISRQTNAAGAPTTIVHYIYDLDGHLIAEANGSLKTTTVGYLREYIWLPANDNNNDTIAEELVAANDNHVPDLPLAVIDVAATPTISQVHTDHLGRPVRMTSATKATTWNTIWTPWGAAHATTGTATNNLRFPGQYFLIETGLAYNWHRSYDPATGRYTQPDPLRFVDGPSVYAYAGNSPFMNVDREGRDTFTAGGTLTGVLGAGGELSTGFLLNPGEVMMNDQCFDFGMYFGAGVAMGLNIGVGGNLGYTAGPASSIDGLSYNASVGVSFLSVSGSVSPNNPHANFSVGAGVGLSPVSATLGGTQTTSITYQKTRRFLRNLFGMEPDQCSCQN